MIQPCLQLLEIAIYGTESNLQCLYRPIFPIGDDSTLLTSKFASRRAKKGFGRKMEKHFSRNETPPTVPMMSMMTIFNDFEFDVPQQSTNNCQKLREWTRFASRHAVTFWHSGRQK